MLNWLNWRFIFFRDLITSFCFFHLESFEFNWETFDDLKGIKIGATIGYNYGKKFQDAERMGGITVLRVGADERLFRMMLKKRVQIFPLDMVVGRHMLHAYFKPDEIRKITYHPKLVSENAGHLLLSKKVERNKDMLRIFNKGLKQLRESGKIVQYLEEPRSGEGPVIGDR